MFPVLCGENTTTLLNTFRFVFFSIFLLLVVLYRNKNGNQTYFVHQGTSGETKWAKRCIQRGQVRRQTPKEKVLQWHRLQVTAQKQPVTTPGAVQTMEGEYPSSLEWENYPRVKSLSPKVTLLFSMLVFACFFFRHILSKHMITDMKDNAG